MCAIFIAHAASYLNKIQRRQSITRVRSSHADHASPPLARIEIDGEDLTEHMIAAGLGRAWPNELSWC